MSTETHCDHCREIAPDARELVVPGAIEAQDERFDLCASCLEELLGWLPWSP